MSGTVVTDGPGGPRIDDEVTFSPHCNVIVTLLAVRYAGLNIGTRWSWRVQVNGGIHVRPEDDLPYGSIEPVNAQIPLGPVGPCGTDFDLRFRVSARQHGSPLPGVGLAISIARFPCPTGERREIAVGVCGRKWWWPPGLCRTARLVFGFRIDASCVASP